MYRLADTLRSSKNVTISIPEASSESAGTTLVPPTESSDVPQYGEGTRLYSIVENVLGVTDDVLGYVEPIASGLATALEYGSQYALLGGLSMFSPRFRQNMGRISQAVTSTKSMISGAKKAQKVKEYVDMMSDPQFYKNMSRYFGGYNDLVTAGIKNALGVNMTDVERRQVRADISQIARAAFTSYTDQEQPFFTSLASKLPTSPFTRDVVKLATDISDKAYSYVSKKGKSGKSVPLYVEAVKAGVRVRDQFIRDRKKYSRYLKIFDPYINQLLV